MRTVRPSVSFLFHLHDRPTEGRPHRALGARARRRDLSPSLARNVAERYPSAKEMLEDIKANGPRDGLSPSRPSRRGKRPNSLISKDSTLTRWLRPKPQRPPAAHADRAAHGRGAKGPVGLALALLGSGLWVATRAKQRTWRVRFSHRDFGFRGLRCGETSLSPSSSHGRRRPAPSAALHPLRLRLRRAPVVSRL